MSTLEIFRANVKFTDDIYTKKSFIVRLAKRLRNYNK